MPEVPRIFYYLGCLTIAQMVIRPFFSLTLSDWFFFIALIVTILNICIKPSLLKVVIPQKMVIGIYLFCMNVFILLFFVGTDNTLFDTIITTVKIVYIWTIWFWLSTTILTSNSHIKIAIFCFGVSCAISAYYGIMEKPEFFWLRPMGLADHVNQFGATSGIGAVLVYPFLSEINFCNIKKEIRFLILPVSIFILCTIGLFVSKSLGAIAAVFISMILWGLVKKKKLKNIAIIVIASVFVFGLLSYQAKQTNFSILHRFKKQTDLSNTTATLTSRLITYQAALPSIIQNPFIGEGSGISIQKTGSHVHNIFLMVLFEFGAIALIGVVLIFISSFEILYFLVKNARGQTEKKMALGLLMGFFVYFFICLKEPILYNRFGWFAIALALAMKNKQLLQQVKI